MRNYLTVLILMTPIVIAPLVACNTISDKFADYPKQVATLQASLAAADHSALIYVSLPACGKTTSKFCRDPILTAKIGKAENDAFAAVEAAYKAEDENSVEAAQTAINLLTSLTSGLPTTATTSN